MSALVLAALVVLWAVVLVPMFLRRSERRAEVARAERFAGAMRVLSRRRRRYAELPPDQRRAAVIAGALAKAPDRGLARPERPSRAAARRRGTAVFAGLVVLTLLVAVLAGGAAWLLQLGVDLLAAAGLLRLRSNAVAEAARRPVRTAPVVETPVPQPVAAPVARPATPAVQPAAYVAAAETPIAAPPRLREPALAGMPADYYDALTPPRHAERLLDEVDTDPDTMTGDLQVLDGILRRAVGE